MSCFLFVCSIYKCEGANIVDDCYMFKDQLLLNCLERDRHMVAKKIRKQTGGLGIADVMDD